MIKVVGRGQASPVVEGHKGHLGRLVGLPQVLMIMCGRAGVRACGRAGVRARAQAGFAVACVM
jgi:hypothetical protein